MKGKMGRQPGEPQNAAQKLAADRNFALFKLKGALGHLRNIIASNGVPTEDVEIHLNHVEKTIKRYIDLHWQHQKELLKQKEQQHGTSKDKEAAGDDIVTTATQLSGRAD